MLNRIFVGLAIAAGIFVGTWGFLKLKPDVETIIAQRLSEKEAKQTALRERDDTRRTLASTETKLRETESNLQTRTTERDRAVAEVQREKTRGDRLAEDLTRSNTERDAAQARLEQWRQVGLEPVQVVSMVKELKDEKEARAAVETENRTLLAKVGRLNNRIRDLVGETYVVELPEGLEGKVLVVDPKWEYCVIDVGSNQGAKEGGELLVSRNGVLISRMRIKRVDKDRSTADFIAGWQLHEVLEGDLVQPANY